MSWGKWKVSLTIFLVNSTQIDQFVLGKMEQAEDGTAKKIESPCDVEALKKCLEENKGNYVKCQSQIEAFRTSCSLKKPSSSPEATPKLSSGR